MPITKIPYPSFYNQDRKKVAETVTPEDWKRWEAEATAYNLSVRQANQEIRTRCSKLCEDAEALYGKNSLVAKYLRRQTLPLLHECDFLWWKSEVERLVAEKKAKEDAEKSRLAQIALNTEATAWLIAKGKVFGVDFNASNAIEFADDIAKQEEIERLKSSHDFIEFSGSSIECDDCAGWDMESNRCACGGKRVGWTTGFGHSFKNPYIYAETH